MSDEEAFRLFAADQWVSLHRVAFLLVGDSGHAEDLVVEVLTNVWFAWPRVRDGAPEAYARRAITNRAASWHRRRWRREAPSAVAADALAVEADADAVGDREVLLQALRTLPPRQRTAVVLRHAEGMSEAEVAEAMGCAVGTVKSLTSRGLARLRAAEYDREDAAGVPAEVTP